MYRNRRFPGQKITKNEGGLVEEKVKNALTKSDKTLHNFQVLFLFKPKNNYKGYRIFTSHSIPLRLIFKVLHYLNVLMLFMHLLKYLKQYFFYLLQIFFL